MKNAIEKVSLKDTIKIFMPDDVLEKIKTLCLMIPKVEWSGVLLYEVDGDISDIEKMHITLRDIIPMNMDTQSYTEYNFNEKARDHDGYDDRHIDYCEEHEDGIYYRIATIHSHNTMPVFFSGTDMDEIIENSASHNFYLSLITNNALDFMAKVAFRAKGKSVGTTDYYALNKDGEEYLVQTETDSEVKEKVLIYDCEIIYDEIVLEKEDFFMSSLHKIMHKPTLIRQQEDSYSRRFDTGHNYRSGLNLGRILDEDESYPNWVDSISGDDSAIAMLYTRNIFFKFLTDYVPDVVSGTEISEVDGEDVLTELDDYYLNLKGSDLHKFSEDLSYVIFTSYFIHLKSVLEELREVFEGNFAEYYLDYLDGSDYSEWAVVKEVIIPSFEIIKNKQHEYNRQ